MYHEVMVTSINDAKDFVIAITCHDAGSSELISRYFLGSPFKLLTSLSGPARNIFESNGFVSDDYFIDLDDQVDLLITGISWINRSYVKLIEQAKEKGIKVLSFLDHWVFSAEDFEFNSKVSLPDAFITFDEYAYSRARNLFPEVSLLRLENHYIEALRNEYEIFLKQDNRFRNTLLFVSEPILQPQTSELVHGNNVIANINFSEIDALNFLIDNLSFIDPNIKHIIIRPHPSENPKKFDGFLYGKNIEISISTNRDLVSDFSRVCIVAGLHTMALAISAKLGIRSVSLIPTGYEECKIPFREIELLREIITERK